MNSYSTPSVLALIVGCVIFLWRRMAPPASLDQRPLDGVVLLCLLFLGVSGYVVEGLRILVADTQQPACSFVGLGVARLLELGGVDAPRSAPLHLTLWWFHAVPALVLVAAFPYTRLMHSIAGSLNLVRQPDSLGKMIPVRLAEVEETGRVGVGQIVDFSSDQLLQLDACVACGRCEEACPAFEAGKPLSPKEVVQDLRRHIDTQAFDVLARLARGEPGELDGALHGGVIDAETLWSCTTCAACVEVCPLRVNPLGLITDMRRHLIGEGELRGTPAMALQKSQRSGNPWGLPAEDRFLWAAGLEVPTVESDPDFEYLYWVGCAASYDRRVQRVARSLIWLLQQAGVRFAVLGQQERCTGESARRMGDEFRVSGTCRNEYQSPAEAPGPQDRHPLPPLPQQPQKRLRAVWGRLRARASYRTARHTRRRRPPARAGRHGRRKNHLPRPPVIWPGSGG